MTPQEISIIALLAQAWNEFLLLPAEHSDDLCEFRHGIHRLQEKILARPTRRDLNEQEDDWTHGRISDRPVRLDDYDRWQASLNDRSKE